MRAASLLLAVALALAACHEPSTTTAPPPPGRSPGPGSGSAPASPGARPAPSAQSRAFNATVYQRTPSAAELTDLGRALFADTALSPGGRQACTSCHDPAHAYGPAFSSPVALAGLDGTSPGLRAVPSLRYTYNSPPFSEHHFDEAVDESVDAGPTGGRDWDGRVDTAHEQAEGPLLSPFEMANESREAVVGRLARGTSAAAFRRTFGAAVFDHPELAFRGLTLALETFQQSPKDFYPFDSKFDAWLRHKATLSAQEMRGFQAFNDQKKGNCASCHGSQIRAGAFPQFTDFGFIAVGVPRNPKIPANTDPKYFDLGLCGPLREDLKGRKEFCGAFRAPSLRNVSRRPVFFHNGAFTDLRQVMEFYASRDTDPGRWYPKGPDGRVRKFDDLPKAYWGNVNKDPPFDRKPGDKPALTRADIDDILVFLKTLDDGYKS